MADRHQDSEDDYGPNRPIRMDCEVPYLDVEIWQGVMI